MVSLLSRVSNFFGRATKDSQFNFWRPGVSRVSSTYVSEVTAMSLGVVNGCVMAIAEAISSSDCEVFSEDKGKRQRHYSDYDRMFNVNANREMTAAEFWNCMVSNAVLRQGAYAELVFSRRGYCREMYPIDPDRVRRVRDDDGSLFYEITNPSGDVTILPPWKMLEVRRVTFDGERVLPILNLAADVFARSMEARDYSTAFFENSGNMGAIWSPKGTMQGFSPMQIDAFKQQFKEEFRGSGKAHGDFFAPVPLERMASNTDPNAAQLIPTEQHLVEEITRFFRVPPHKVQHLLRSTYSNIEHQGLEFVRDAIVPWTTRFRQEIRFKVFGNREPNLIARWNLDWLTEGDAQSVAAADQAKIFSGSATVDEVRSERGRNSFGGQASEPIVQGAMVPLKKLGETNGKLDPS